MRWLMAVLAACLVCGCGIMRNDVTFLKGGRWSAQARITIPAQVLSMYGGEAGFESLMQQQLDADEWKLFQQGIKVERSKDGSITYLMARQGTDLDSLNDELFSGLANISRRPDGTIEFYYAPGWGAQAYGLRLTGGRILSSNADEIKGNTAIWNDLMRSGSAEAVLTESTGASVNPGLLGAGAVLIVAAVALYSFARSRGHAPVGAQTPTDRAVSGEFCMRCGAKLMPGAQFCHSCGADIAPGKAP